MTPQGMTKKKKKKNHPAITQNKTTHQKPSPKTNSTKTEFPPSALVNIPDHIFLPGHCGVSVRINNNSNIKKIKDYYKNRLHHFESDHNLCGNTKALQALQKAKIRIRMFDDDLSLIGDNIDLLRKTKPVFILKLNKNTIKHINFITTLNFPVHIDACSEPPETDILTKVLEYYLHSPLLTVNIEPFHTLLQTEGKGAGFNLWDTEFENWKTDLYVSQDKKISLSRRWADHHLTYGTLKDTWDNITNSKLYIVHAEYKQSLFKQKSPCVFCPYLTPCGAHLKAIDPNWPCDGWKAAFKSLKNEVKKAKELLKNYDGQ